MSVLLQCILRSCFNMSTTSNNGDNGGDDDQQTSTTESILAPRPLSFNRAERAFGSVNSTVSSYRPPDTLGGNRQVAGGACNEYEQHRQPLNPSAVPAVEGEIGVATENSHEISSTSLRATENSSIRNNGETNQISDFFSRFRGGLNLHPRRRPPPRDAGGNVDTLNMMRKIALILSTNNNKDTKEPSPHSPPLTPLRVAHEFTQRPSCDDIPALTHYEEVVLPGSNLQKLMSESLRERGYCAESEEDECVVCMEGFDATNPRMPTRCGCGENQTYFHLPCLYQWVELRREGGARSGECPTCRELLQWDEF